MRFLVILCLIFLPIEASAAIAFDTSAFVSNATNPSTSITRGTGASNYIGIVQLLPSGGSRTSSGCTWGGVSMTQIYDSNESINGANGHFYGFYIVNPSSGSQTVSCTTTNTYYMDILTFSGVNQSTPIDTNYDGAGNSYARNTATSVTSITVSGTSHVDGVVGVGQWANTASGNMTGGTNTTRGPNISMYNTAPIASPGTVSLIATDISQNWLAFNSGMQPASGAASTPPMFTEF